MVWSFLITVSLSLTWMLSPDALVILGNSAGLGGLMFFAPLALGALLSLWSVSLIHHPLLDATDSTITTRVISELGIRPAMTIILAGRISLVLLIPTGILVTAGFTFNETFLYWFPNFGFSFLLLGTILSLHLIGKQFALAMQPLFIGITICCLLTLSLAGLTGPKELQLVSINNGFTPTLSLFLTAQLLFLGYDQKASARADNTRQYFSKGIIIGFILLFLWAFASLLHVAPGKLAASTIPYITGAREILGQPGRILIGIAIISGTCGAVNGLFLLTNVSLVQLTDELFLKKISATGWKNRLYPVIFSLFIAIFMAMGLAGSEKLEIYIQGSLLLWLITVGVHCFCTTRKLLKKNLHSAWHGYMPSAIFPLCAVGLAWLHPQNGQIFVFCLLAITTSAIFSAALLWLGKRHLVQH